MKNLKYFQQLLHFLLTAFCLVPFTGISQSRSVVSNNVAFNVIQIEALPNTHISEGGYVKSISGSNYLNDQWTKADILFAKDSLLLTNTPVKVDLKNHTIELDYKGQIKLLNANDTYHFTLTETGGYFITNKTLGGNSPEGFYQVLYNEKSGLLCHYSTKIKKANYNVALDVGIKDDEIIMEKKYYYLIGKKLIPVPSSRKKFISYLADKNEKLSTFIKENKINPKKEQSLITFLKYYDSISTQFN